MPLDAEALSAMEEPGISDQDLEDLDESQLESSTGQEPGSAAPVAESQDALKTSAAESTEQQQPAAEEPARPRDSGLIPRHRYNYQRQQRDLAERRAAEAEQRLQALETQLAQQQAPASSNLPVAPAELETQLADLDTKIEEARADGDTNLVKQLRAQSRALERDFLASQLHPQVQPAQQVDPRALTQQTIETLRLEQTINALEAQFPMFDESSDQFDPDLSEEVMSLYDALLPKVRSPSQAMLRAVEYVTKTNGLVEPQAPKARGTNVQRNVEAAKAQPPSLQSVGVDASKAGVTSKFDLDRMTQDDFENLPTSDIDKLLLQTAI